MTGIIFHEDFSKHDPGWGHPECPDRLNLTMKFLREKDILGRPEIKLVYPDSANEQDLALAHTKKYIDSIKRISKHRGMLTSDTPVKQETYDLAKLSVGGAILAGKIVSSGEMKNSFLLNRPPGHHAGRDYGGGFCYFNNIAIMVESIRQEYGFKKFMILDWDVHHGNGTQDIFYDDPSVLYFSTHQMPLFPGTGRIEELGEKEGVGYNVNVPLSPGSTGADCSYAIDKLFIPLAREYRPDFIAISAGQDAYFADSLADLNFILETYVKITKQVMKVAEEVCNERIAIVLEGGYNLEALPRIIAAIITTLAEIKDIELSDPYLAPKQIVSSTVEKDILKMKALLADYWKVF
ncbi:MAG: histone deacetylase [Candidatus Bathyarchaeota archaeon]|nr:histone deacetylase [Candidatus Bathyarchaeota archaeon]MCZ2845244.1 histone deacetylase [Candidatus Bathyarchaeota archaeon]